jgi:lipid-A-disaccharide synthase
MTLTPQPNDIATDILILSNGPGELMTWVYPFLKALETSLEISKELPEAITKTKTRISVALAPCQNSSGQESQTAIGLPKVDRVLPQEQFFDFLLWGKTPDWQWSKQGIVVFLGGDQFFAVAIAKRLGYKVLIYAEWEARWHRWADLFAVRNVSVLAKIPASYQYKATVIGDLMVDRLDTQPRATLTAKPQICMMPGSKGNKLRIGVPLMVAIADILKQQRPDIELVIPLAPTTTSEIIAQYAQVCFPTADSEGSTAILVNGNLLTAKGNLIKIHHHFPAHAIITRSQLCITTVGANTAELASLHQPMLVLLPTNFSDIKVGWDGLWGLLASAPLLGKVLSRLINSILISQIAKKGQLLSWPNIWAGEAIVPELLGKLTPTQIADQVLFYLDHPEELDKMRDRLKEVCGQAGAASKLAAIVIKSI